MSSGLTGSVGDGISYPITWDEVSHRRHRCSSFDLAVVGQSTAIYVRIVDIKGNGSAKDSSNRPIYDPYPTSGSAGFDLEAVGVINQQAACGAVDAGDPIAGLARIPFLFGLLALMRVAARRRPERARVQAVRR
jgi:hypothetical protein